jgi:hypothetical protein
MASETIQVYFEPLGSIEGVTYYHETLVYTNASGEQFLATAYASTSPTGNPIANLSEASSAAVSDGSSPYGKLITQWGPLSSLSPQEVDHWLGTPSNPYPSQTLATGSDLSAHWNSITQAYSEIGSEGLPYSPATQNSNSVASTGLTAAGIQLPNTTDIFDSIWAPASGVILPTSQTPSSDDQSVYFTTDAGGNINLAISDYYGSGALQDNASFNFNATGSPTGASLDPPAGANFTLVGTGDQDTIVGSGLTISATGSGDTLTLSGTGITITDNGSGDVVTDNGSGNILAFNGDDSAFASSDTITVANGIFATIAGNSDVINLGSNSSGDFAGTGNTINAANDGITLGAYSEATVVGRGDDIGFSASGDTVYASSDSIGITSYYSETVDGNADILYLYTQSSAVVTGTGETINATNEEHFHRSNADYTIGADTSRLPRHHCDVGCERQQSWRNRRRTRGSKSSRASGQLGHGSRCFSFRQCALSRSDQR